MSPCSGIRADGARCRAQAMRGSEFCINHHPDRAEARRRRASKGGKRGGRGRPLTELVAVKHRLMDLADAVIEGRQDRGCAAVAGQLLNTAIRALEVERKWHETDELEARLSELEGYAAHRGGGAGKGQAWRA
jgi:hypothetical protein